MFSGVVEAFFRVPALPRHRPNPPGPHEPDPTVLLLPYNHEKNLWAGRWLPDFLKAKPVCSAGAGVTSQFTVRNTVKVCKIFIIND